MIAKLEMLLALAKEQHFGRAAESMGITQPTLSTGIRQLEGQLGVKLVQRGSRYGGLTPEGQRALVWARQIVGDTRKLREEMRYSQEGLAGHVRLAVIPTALTWAARLTSRFSAKHPNVSFSILSRSSVDLLAMLENLDADAGITYLDNEPLGRMASVGLYSEHYALLCPPDHAYAKRKNVQWQDLGGLRLCLLTPDMQNRRIINRNLMEAGLEPKTLIESNSTIVLVSNVIEGGFVTVLPTDLARFLSVGHDLSVVPIAEGGLVPTVGLIAVHQEPYTPVLQSLMRAAAEIAK
ncbi:LysR family transcriptional regulator [Falsiphaeobacter marinintestinus]|uniref:LysR family transcriptional regulator n=1 Tax=Falsiphaeobacter marinintestinus TaxID=1492905 RepID=UPI0011B7FF51|nr:LysR family transcriptional regulator [Phaeobacter marinintestinus]